MTKRMLDIVLSLVALTLLSPLMLILGALVRIESPGPALFRQTRVGRGGRPFTLLKFRTMTISYDPGDNSFRPGNTRRVTWLGRILRAYKLDELPQFVNVLLGDMSIVGPRPEVSSWVQEYPQRWARVHQVRPGITCPASLEFRDEESILAAAADPREEYRMRILPRKLDLYESYVAQQTLRADMRIIAQTFRSMFTPAPAVQPEPSIPAAPAGALAKSLG